MGWPTPSSRYAQSQASGIVGQSIAESDVRRQATASTSSWCSRPTRHRTRKWLHADPSLVFEPEDTIFVSGEHQQVWDLCETELLQFGMAEPAEVERILAHGATMAEVSVSPHSRALGRTFKDMDFRKRFGLNVLALFRKQEVHREGLADHASCRWATRFSSPARPSACVRSRGIPTTSVLTDQTQAEDVTRAPLAILILMIALVPPACLLRTSHCRSARSVAPCS